LPWLVVFGERPGNIFNSLDPLELAAETPLFRGFR
jgi:hypothetical protein